MKSRRILFLGNDTGRTGAPIVLLEVAREFRKKGWSCLFIFEKDGALSTQFQELGKCAYWYPNLDKQSIKYLRWAMKLLYRLGFDKWHKHKIKNSAKEFSPNVIYANTGVTGYMVKQLHMDEAPVVMHVHEMEGILKNHCGTRFTEGIPYIDKYIAVNKQIQQTLCDNYHILVNKTEVIPAFLPYSFDEADFTKKTGSNGFVIGAAGVPSHRKGTDWFIKTAASLLSIHNTTLKFKWIGFDAQNASNKEYIDLIKELGLIDKLELVPPTADPLNEFKEFDVLLLTSREDPNPLVVLEAGKLGIPVICFKGSGATEQITEEGGGVAVEMGNIDEIVRSILLYANNKQLLEKHSLAIRHIINNRFDKQKNINAIYSIVTELIKKHQ